MNCRVLIRNATQVSETVLTYFAVTINSNSTSLLQTLRIAIYYFFVLVVSACTDAQNAYDQKKKDGQLGHMEVRPICDADGKFKSAKCIPNEM